MKRAIILFLLLLFFSTCHRNDDALVGRWVVEKVSVDFDERIATPEMVRQYGEMEQGNVIEITQDSMLTLVSEGDTLTGRYALEGNQLHCNGKPFGRYENGTIQTESSTLVGKIVVKYRKE